MRFQPHELELLQSGEEQQLGTFISSHQRYTTLSGKMIFTGLLLIVIGIVGLGIQLLTPHGLYSSPGFLIPTLPEWGQLVFMCGLTLGSIGGNGLVLPFQARLSIDLYTDGFIYRKGRASAAIYWEQIKSIRRQYPIQRRKKRLASPRITYICEMTELPALLKKSLIYKLGVQNNLVLDFTISDVDEIGASIERELTRRLLPQTLANFQDGQRVAFAGLTLTQQEIRYREKDVAWERVSSIQIDPEKLIIEKDGIHAAWVTVFLSDISNLCVLEALLEVIQREKGFDLSLTTGESTQALDTPEGYALRKRKRSPRRTSWVSTVVLGFLVVCMILVEIISLAASFQHTW